MPKKTPHVLLSLSCVLLVLLSLMFVACDGSIQSVNTPTPTHEGASQTTGISTEASSVSPTQTQVVISSPTAGSDVAPTGCPTVPSGAIKITNFAHGTSGFQPEEHNDASKVVNLSSMTLGCGTILKIHTTLSGNPDLEDSMRHTVILSSKIPQHDFSQEHIQIGCLTFFPASIAALDGQGYYLRISAISAGYANDVSGDMSGTETLVHANTGRWTYSFVNVQKGPDADSGFQTSKVIAFSIAITANQLANNWEGDFYVGACMLIHSWPNTPSNPLDMPAA